MSKIIYLVTEDWYFWSHRRLLAADAAGRNYQVIVATGKGAYTNRMREQGFIPVSVSIHRSVGSPLTEIRTLVDLISLYIRYKPDLVHQVALKPVFLGTLAAKICRVPIIINAYTGLGHVFITPDSLKSWLIRYCIFPFIAPVLRSRNVWSIVQNRDDKAQLLKYGLICGKRVSVIRGSGVDLNEFTAAPEPEYSQPLILFPARLLKEKGIMEFIGAARILKQRHPGAGFVITGSLDVGNPTCIAMEDLRQWMDEGIVEWWGYREDMASVYQQVNIVCLPSYREGLPRVLLEAAATGRSIVATDVPGCREIVIHEHNGLLVPPADTEKLASALERLIEDAELRSRFGTNGRKLVEGNFSAAEINRQTLELYGQVIISFGKNRTSGK